MVPDAGMAHSCGVASSRVLVPSSRVLLMSSRWLTVPLPLHPIFFLFHPPNAATGRARHLYYWLPEAVRVQEVLSQPPARLLLPLLESRYWYKKTRRVDSALPPCLSPLLPEPPPTCATMCLSTQTRPVNRCFTQDQGGLFLDNIHVSHVLSPTVLLFPFSSEFQKIKVLRMAVPPWTRCSRSRVPCLLFSIPS